MAKGVKTGGRELGTPNRSTEQLRQTVQVFIENNIEGMQTNFDQLEAKDKLLFIEKMLNYSLPRIQSAQLDIRTPHTIEYVNVSKQYTDK